LRKYLVIGGSSGIGKSIIDILTNNGEKVFATYNKNIGKSENVDFHFLDVTLETINLDFLPDELDGLVYCPGAINLKPFARIKSEDFLNDFSLQVVGAVKVIQAVLPKLKKSQSPSIVLFSTVAVQTGFPFHSLVSASKGAIEGLTKALAAELAPTIRVNCVAPSITDTPLASALLNTEDKKEANAQRHPLKKIGKPGDIGEMVQFLLSEKAGWITGQIFHVDGGISTIKT
jgi:NAD(P)-dependent dehydrogenase (short-subunit alcohol dehydrogenase family)